MRLSTIAASLVIAAVVPLATMPAEAQKFSPYVKNCKKAQEFERSEVEYVVPVVGGSVGKVQVVSQAYDCVNKSTRNGETIRLEGLKNASGKLIIPYAYESVLPFSTTGAVVGAYGPTPFTGSGGYRVYLAGKGEGKERFSFTPQMMTPENGCPLTPGEASFSRVSAVISEDVFNRRGRTQVTLFTPEGTARVTAQYAADGKWVTFRANSDTVVGDIDADFERSRDGAWALLEAQSQTYQEQVAAESARRQAERAETHKRNWQTARSIGRLCQVRADATNTREDFEEYLAACGPDDYLGFAQLALSKGVQQSAFDAAANAQAMRMMEVYKARAQWKEQARLDRMRNANKDPLASYMPGQWESAIRNAGNAATSTSPIGKDRSGRIVNRVAFKSGKPGLNYATLSFQAPAPAWTQIGPVYEV